MQRTIGLIRQMLRVEVMYSSRIHLTKKPLLSAVATLGLALIPFSGFSHFPGVQSTPPRPQYNGFFAEPGLPFSATQLTERTQTLLDGTHIVSKSKLRVYRDTSGRLRVESFQMRPGSEELEDAPSTVGILDPVAGYQYSLLIRGHSGIRSDLGGGQIIQDGTARSSGAGRAAGPVARGPESHTSTESLGTQIMAGLEVEGSKSTTTYPPHFSGNDAPIVATYEEWRSLDFRIVVFSIRSDPRSGETKVTITDFSRTEPDPSLFQVPSDYTIRAH